MDQRITMGPDALGVVSTESFNIFNHPNFGLPNTSIGTPAAGTISSTVSSPRQNQFALKLLF